MLPRSGSLLRYPGGKRHMLDFLEKHLPSAQDITGSYVEPFLGGAAVFFFVQPSNAILSDANSDLIDIYRGVRFAPRKVWKLYCNFGCSKEDYFNIRDYWRGRDVTERAARMLYLNRTCFKGMWRHNRKGAFNVGYGGEARRWVISEDELVAVSQILKNKTIKCTDFQKAIEQCQTHDFIFVDPPYRPHEKEYNNFHYNGRKFGLDDHKRLASTLNRASKRNVRWALTTSSHHEIVQLFPGSYAVEIPRGTGGMPGIRSANSGEILITNYQSQGGTQL